MSSKPAACLIVNLGHVVRFDYVGAFGSLGLFKFVPVAARVPLQGLDYAKPVCAALSRERLV